MTHGGYKALFWFLIGTFFWVHHLANSPRALPPGPVVREEPEQTLIEGGKPWLLKGYTITPLATYRIRARVLRTERYHFDRESELSPEDLALGWRSMSDSANLKRLSISQGGRWYYFHYRQAPLADEDILAHSSNNHMIPGNPEVASTLKKIQVDHIIRAQGYLVAVQGKDGYRWQSSLSRTDTGARSCELFWTDRLEIE